MRWKYPQAEEIAIGRQRTTSKLATPSSQQLNVTHGFRHKNMGNLVEKNYKLNIWKLYFLIKIMKNIFAIINNLS
jgi:hypothetical protein